MSGLIALAAMRVLALVEMPVLRRDPQNLAQFGSQPDLSSAIAGDFLAAGVNHLVLVGVVVGSVLASAGAAIAAARPPG